MQSTSTTQPSARAAGAVQGCVLIAAAWLAVMANQVIAPVLPTMTEYFKSVASVDVLISFTATGPALFVALLAMPFGLLGDRIGHKRVLFAATLLYGVVGTAPLWLPSLQSIVVSRALVGVAEAAIMTCSTALIGAYFIGRGRERYMALQTGTAPIISILATFLGGALGAAGWRMPFYLYGFAFLLIPLTGWLLWEPGRETAQERNRTQATAQKDEPFNWGMLIWICAVTMFAMMAFLVTAIQSSFVLSERGLTSPAAIGAWVSVAMLANPMGALIFGLLPWHSVPKLALSFGLICLGHGVIALLPTWQTAIAGAAIANLGAGMILPTTITWALATLPAAQRGTGTGLWVSANFLGQFLSPLSIVALRQITGSLPRSILIYSVACGISAIIALICATKPAGKPAVVAADP